MPPKLSDEERTRRSKERRKTRAAKDRAKRLPKFKQKRTRGTTPIYEAEAHCSRAHSLALLGLTDAEIAHQFGVNELTINVWKKKHPEFAKAVNDGKTPADALVAAAAFKRAIGYDYPAVKIFAPPTPGAEPTYAPYMEHYPGDVRAQQIWLYNRQRHLWKDRQQIDVSGTLEHRMAAMTAEERAADALAFAGKLRQALIEARRNLTIEGEASEAEE